MDVTRRLEIELPEDIADAVSARVASGEFVSESEVVRAGLELIEDRQRGDADSAAHLAAGYDAWRANPSSILTSEEVDRRLQEQRAQFSG